MTRKKNIALRTSARLGPPASYSTVEEEGLHESRRHQSFAAFSESFSRSDSNQSSSLIAQSWTFAQSRCFILGFWHLMHTSQCSTSRGALFRARSRFFEWLVRCFGTANQSAASSSQLCAASLRVAAIASNPGAAIPLNVSRRSCSPRRQVIPATADMARRGDLAAPRRCRAGAAVELAHRLCLARTRYTGDGRRGGAS